MVGVTLGQAGQIYFVPGNKAVKEAGPPPRAPADVGADGAADALRTCVKTYPASGSFAIEIYLPRRAMYVMSGAARTEWKHGIRQQKPGALPPPPAWNRFNMRRALTLRATKAFSDACLQQRLRQATSESEATELQRRIAQQAKFRPSNSDARLDDSDLAELRSRAESMRVRVATMPYLRARFSPSELTFPLPPSAAREAAEVVGASARGGGPENLWPGGGRRLGGGAACGTSGADDTNCARGAEWTVRSGVGMQLSDEDEDMHAAIQASLREGSGPPPPHPSVRLPKRRIGDDGVGIASYGDDSVSTKGDGGAAGDPIKLDSESDDQEDTDASLVAAPFSRAVAAAVHANPWPYAQGEGHLGVKLANSVEANQRILSRAVAHGSFTAAEALHRMTDGEVNLDGTRNGTHARPTLATKWARNARAGTSVAQVEVHVLALKRHLAKMVEAQLAQEADGLVEPKAESKAEPKAEPKATPDQAEAGSKRGLSDDGVQGVERRQGRGEVGLELEHVRAARLARFA